MILDKYFPKDIVNYIFGFLSVYDILELRNKLNDNNNNFTRKDISNFRKFFDKQLNIPNTKDLYLVITLSCECKTFNDVNGRFNLSSISVGSKFKDLNLFLTFDSNKACQLITNDVTTICVIEKVKHI